jgi:hypothetical protein
MRACVIQGDETIKADLMYATGMRKTGIGGSFG